MRMGVSPALGYHPGVDISRVQFPTGQTRVAARGWNTSFSHEFEREEAPATARQPGTAAAEPQGARNSRAVRYKFPHKQNIMWYSPVLLTQQLCSRPGCGGAPLRVTVRVVFHELIHVQCILEFELVFLSRLHPPSLRVTTHR